MKYKNLLQFFSFSNAYSVIQFNIFNIIIKNLLLPIIDKLLNIDYNISDLYICKINIKPVFKDILILIIIFIIFNIFIPIKL